MKAVWFTTDRREGNARAAGALARLLRSKGFPVSLATAEQVHGTKVALVPSLFKPKTYAGTDGLLTEVPRQPLAVFTADCVPVFLASKDGWVAGVLHAGWRGVRGGILPRAIRLLRRRWRVRPSEIVAWVGPAIGPCCYEVGWEVARHFPSSRRRLGRRSAPSPKRLWRVGDLGGGGWRVDLIKELTRQARQLCIRWDHQRSSRGCTMHDKRFFSHRRDRTEKRQVSVIMKG